MTKDLQITYITIAVLILILGSVAYVLQDSSSTEDIVQETSTTTIKKVTTTSNTKSNNSTTTMQSPEKITRAMITTNKGVIEVSFATNTPLTVKNFATLAQSKFYDGVRFHRVIKDFMIQTGDPLSKDLNSSAMWGTGGPGYKFADELTGNEQYPLGTLAMANAGPNTNGSQFFIVTANPGYPLPPSYTVFGKVTKGLDVALKIQDVATGEQNRPLEEVVIQKVEVFE